MASSNYTGFTDGSHSAFDREQWQQCQDALERIYLFFNEVTYSLKPLDLTESHDFKVTNTVTLHDLKKRNFVCNTKRKEFGEISAFTFRYHLIGDNHFNIKIVSQEEAEFLSKILDERRIRYRRYDENPNVIPRHILFDITPKITTRFVFTPSTDRKLILLKISNYDGKWDQTLKFKPERLNDQLLDEIAKYALHQDNEFLEITGNRLSLSMLEKLRAQLHGEENKKHPQPDKHGLLDIFKRHIR